MLSRNRLLCGNRLSLEIARIELNDHGSRCVLKRPAEVVKGEAYIKCESQKGKNLKVFRSSPEREKAPKCN